MHNAHSHKAVVHIISVHRHGSVLRFKPSSKMCKQMWFKWLEMSFSWFDPDTANRKPFAVYVFGHKGDLLPNRMMLNDIIFSNCDALECVSIRLHGLCSAGAESFVILVPALSWNMSWKHLTCISYWIERKQTHLFCACRTSASGHPSSPLPACAGVHAQSLPYQLPAS